MALLAVPSLYALQTSKSMSMGSKHPVFLSRRQIMRGFLAAGAFGATSRFGVGSNCTSATETGFGGFISSSAANSSDVVVGFVYAGDINDCGWNQAHFEGEQGIAKHPNFKVVEKARVPETRFAQAIMLNMIQRDRATALFLTSFDYYDPDILELAAAYPKVQFFHTGWQFLYADRRYTEGTRPKNVGSYFGYIDEAQYVAGIVAAHMSKSGKLGFVAGKPIPYILRNINSYTLGARTVNPKATTHVIFTGDWSLPVKEVEAVYALADEDIDVVTCHVNSPKAIMEAAEKREIYCTGYHANQSKLAPTRYLTGAEWNWSKLYEDYAKLLQDGKSVTNGGIPHLVSGGYKEGYVKVSDYGPAVTAAAKQDADAAKAELKAGTLVIYKGPIKDNTGKVVIPAGKEFKQKDTELEEMNWLVEGCVGLSETSG